MSHLSVSRTGRSGSRSRRRARQSVATAVFAMGLVMSVFATPSLADDLGAANAAPAPTLQECRTALERTGRIDDDCAPHRRQLLEEQRAAQEKAAAEKAAQEKAAAEKAAAEKAAAEKAAAEQAAARQQAPAQLADEPIVAALGPEDCGPGEIYNPVTDECDEVLPPIEECPEGQEDHNGVLPGCGEPPVEECPEGEEDYNGVLPGCGEPPVEGCPPGQTDHNGPLPGCGEPPVEECPDGQTDYNGDGAGCGLPPVNPGGGDNGNGNGNGNGGNGNNGNNGGNGNGGTAGEQIGSVSGTPEGTGSVVNQCGGSAVCSAAAPAPVAESSTDGLPDTGAPESRGLALGGLALLLGGTLLLRPRREVGRHRLGA